MAKVGIKSVKILAYMALEIRLEHDRHRSLTLQVAKRYTLEDFGDTQGLNYPLSLQERTWETCRMIEHSIHCETS